MATPTTKTVVPIPVKSNDLDIIQKAMSTRDKNSKFFFQTIDGKLFEVSGNAVFKKVPKV